MIECFGLGSVDNKEGSWWLIERQMFGCCRLDFSNRGWDHAFERGRVVNFHDNDRQSSCSRRFERDYHWRTRSRSPNQNDEVDLRQYRREKIEKTEDHQ